MCSGKKRAAGMWRIAKELDAVWTYFCPSKPCLSLSTDGTIVAFAWFVRHSLVDWVFYNQSGGQYVIGHGGGAAAQHSYCTDIPWSEAQPGGLVFYPNDTHVGIVCGFDSSGNVLIIHCSSGYNNVVVTGENNFTSTGKPQILK